MDRRAWWEPGEELGVFVVAPAQCGFQRFYRRSILSTLVSAGSSGRWRTSVALGVVSSVLMTPSELIILVSEDTHARFSFGKDIVGEIRAMLEPVRVSDESADRAASDTPVEPNREQHRLRHEYLHQSHELRQIPDHLLRPAGHSQIPNELVRWAGQAPQDSQMPCL